MEVKLKTLRNKRRGQMSLLVGEGYALEGGSEITLPKNLADEALELYPEDLEEVEFGALGKDVVEEKSRLVYLANLSGDPDAPGRVTVRVRKDPSTGAPVEITEENRLAKATPFKHEYTSGQFPETFTANGVKQQKGNPRHKLVVEPGTRIGVERRIAEGLLASASLNKPESRRWVIEAREPGKHFEPRQTWSLDQLRAWLYMVEKDLKICGPSEADLRKSIRPQTSAKADIAVEEARRLMWRRCWLRMVDPLKDIPGKSAFERFVGLEQIQEQLGLTSAQSKKVANAKKVS